MCAQVVCEVPPDMQADACAGQVCDPAPCVTSCPPTGCGPCQSPCDYTPCPPGGCCDCRGDGGDFCCYSQPPRTQPIRPCSNFVRSNAPLDTDTIYKRSYIANCGDCYRSRPIYPCANMISSKEPMEKCTVQKLSYLPPCGVPRTQPIRPPENGLKFCGPLYAMTSQKHDYVPKYVVREPLFKPNDSIMSSGGPIEKCTINRLSYMPVDVCQYPPRKPITHGSNYLPPSGPMEKCTVQKLSYMPVCIPPKEPMPWADQIRCIPPRYEDLCTTYRLSYIPNCGVNRTAPIRPFNSIGIFGNERHDGNTIYKLSYIPNDPSCCRQAPIRPVGAFVTPTGPMEKCTIQRLSYQPNCSYERTRPIRPKENCMTPQGPVYAMTTQKHDFVPKPVCRRALIVPASNILPTTGPMEKCTVNKLSYMPINVCENPRPKPIRPNQMFVRDNAPIENCTTYKLSYLPNCIQPREKFPWGNTTSYCRPTAPIEKCTIQRLSYAPPGNFSRCGGPCQANQSSGFPKAGICN